MSNYIYQSDIPEKSPDSGKITQEKKERRKHRRSRALYVCLFGFVAIFTFASILFLSGFISIDKNSDSLPTGSAAVQMIGPQY